MQFCPKCGAILIPKKDGKKVSVSCSCGYSSKDVESAQVSEKVENKGRKIEVVEKEIETLPLTDAECDKCGHKKAYFWEVQTRASDEPATKFLKCQKCKHIWRDYN